MNFETAIFICYDLNSIFLMLGKENNGTKMISQAVPTTSPSVIPSVYLIFSYDYFLFLKLKMKLEGQYFDTILKIMRCKRFRLKSFSERSLLEIFLNILQLL